MIQRRDPLEVTFVVIFFHSAAVRVPGLSLRLPVFGSEVEMKHNVN